MLTILITLLGLWLLWKLFKFSFWLLGLLIAIALAWFFFKILIMPLALGGAAIWWMLKG